mgnify:CR=1 FL=1
MIVDERMVTFINSLDTETQRFRADRAGGAGYLCTDHPEGDAELSESTACDAETEADFRGWNGCRIFCNSDE